MTISSGWANSCTCAPESAQYAVTSSASGPGPKPFVRPLGAAVGAIRSTIQSLPEVDHAPAGAVTEPKPSLEVAVVGDEGVVFFSTGPEVPTVKCTRKGRRLPLASCSSPASVCAPG